MLLCARAGLQTLPKAIAAKVEDNVRCNWKLAALAKGSDGLYELTYDTPDGSRTVKAKSVGLTAPSYVVAELLEPVAPQAAAKLGSVDYPPVCAVTLAYPESAIKVRAAARVSEWVFAVEGKALVGLGAALPGLERSRVLPMAESHATCQCVCWLRRHGRPVCSAPCCCGRVCER